MQLGAAQHEVSTRVAGLRAVQQGFDVLGIGVLAAHAQAVHERLGADVVALRAAVDAVVHLVRDGLGLQVMAHRDLRRG